MSVARASYLLRPATSRMRDPLIGKLLQNVQVPSDIDHLKNGAAGPGPFFRRGPAKTPQNAGPGPKIRRGPSKTPPNAGPGPKIRRGPAARAVG